jgi:hypothetical protein
LAERSPALGGFIPLARMSPVEKWHKEFFKVSKAIEKMKLSK